MDLKEYKRGYPLFSLCGLNCGLCPRYQTNGESKCPGCGGKDFHLKHPACAVITCTGKHDQAEYCFRCSSYPCKRFEYPSKTDSFITYRNVIADFEKAHKDGLVQYQTELNEKVEILEFLINNYNDGRRKNFYCIAVNLLKLDDLRNIMKEITERISKQDTPIKDKIEQVTALFQAQAAKDGVELRLRK